MGALYIAPALQSKMTPAAARTAARNRACARAQKPPPRSPGLPKAVAQRADQLEEILAHTRAMRDYALERLLSIPTVQVLGTPDAPHILCLTLPGYPSQNLVSELGDKGICISAGSACHKGKPSHVIAALRLSKKGSRRRIPYQLRRENHPRSRGRPVRRRACT